MNTAAEIKLWDRVVGAVAIRPYLSRPRLPSCVASIGIPVSKYVNGPEVEPQKFGTPGRRFPCTSIVPDRST